MKVLLTGILSENWRTCNIDSPPLGCQLNRRDDGDKESITVAEWAPVVDIVEDGTEYLVKVDLPEIKKAQASADHRRCAIWRHLGASRTL
ncbi:MAG TPA: hypothetical protein VK775_01260 [Chthoniobacterales bacterium]|jgi:hypothetical protein|nr:hypothetical protein [Chthoniobacterales bacterium]